MQKTHAAHPVARLLAAVDAMDIATVENIERMQEVRRRLDVIRRRCAEGASVSEIVGEEQPPRIVEMLSANMTTLETAGAELRAAQALALRADGLTIEAIAELFGVTRQRISALLKQHTAA